jgi:hypothetical protein
MSKQYWFWVVYEAVGLILTGFMLAMLSMHLVKACG